MFLWVLPRKAGQQKAFFEDKHHYPETQMFYESPYRIKDTLTNMLACYGDRQVVLVRELTKLLRSTNGGRFQKSCPTLRKHP